MAGDKKETPRMVSAFEYYYELGTNRSFYKVADHFGVSGSTVRSWALQHEWEKRVDERNERLKKVVKEKTDDDFIKEMELNRKIISSSLADFTKRLRKGEIKVTRIKDAVDLLKLDAAYVNIILKLKNDTRISDNMLDNIINFSITTNPVDVKDQLLQEQERNQEAK